MAERTEVIATLPFPRKRGIPYSCHSSGKTVKVLENGRVAFDTGVKSERDSLYSLSGKNIVRRWDPDWFDDLLDDEDDDELSMWVAEQTKTLEKIAKPLKMKVTRRVIVGYDMDGIIAWDLESAKPVAVAPVRKQVGRLGMVALGEEFPTSERIRVLPETTSMLEVTQMIEALHEAFRLTPKAVTKALTALGDEVGISNVWATESAITVWLGKTPRDVAGWATKLTKQLRPASIKTSEIAAMLGKRCLELRWP